MAVAWRRHRAAGLAVQAGLGSVGARTSVVVRCSDDGRMAVTVPRSGHVPGRTAKAGMVAVVFWRHRGGAAATMVGVAICDRNVQTIDGSGMA
ncbi:hypothetical protein E2562_031671 [Oryza meyeriana var. granulata]|uniref:Uncharacterized protein n=1 Tax=Oryza meyeriana var. granulata TaxID=110450 RepID=A0A6G1E574_9ORYZ|nr:hypothetical protein E2562_031671 [Oryza meyeriana var. granulata]